MSTLAPIELLGTPGNLLNPHILVYALCIFLNLLTCILFVSGV